MEKERQFLGLTEASQVLGISKNALSNIRRRDPDFPQPFEEIASGPLWRSEDIYAYGRKTQRISEDTFAIPVMQGSSKKILILGRARGGKSFLIGMFAEDSFNYRKIFCGGGDDKTQCPINNFFIDGNFSFIEFHSDFPTIYRSCDDLSEEANLSSEIELLTGIQVSMHDIDNAINFVKKVEDVVKRIREIQNNPIHKNKKKSNTYINVYTQASKFCKDIMRKNNLKRLEVVDNPGVSGDVEVAKISKADLYVFLLKPDSAREAETLLQIVQEVKPFVASSDVCFLYKSEEYLITNDDYKEAQENAKRDMLPFEKLFSDLKGNIISSTMDILNPANSCIIFPRMHKSSMTLPEELFQKAFSDRIYKAFSADSDELLLKDFEFFLDKDPSSVQSFVLQLFSAIPKHNVTPITSGQYTLQDFANGKHDRVKTNDRYRILSDLNLAYTYEKTLLYRYFSQFTSNNYPEIWQQSVIKYLFNVLTKAADNDCGIGIGTYFCEDSPALTMIVEESMLASTIYSSITGNTYPSKAVAYRAALLNGGVTSKTWDYVYCQDDSMMLKKLEIIDRYLCHIPTNTRTDMILFRYMGGLRKLAQYKLLYKFYNSDSRCMSILAQLPF